MKKSFMTRVLATGLSVAMAFSLSTATNLVSAQAASKPVLVDYTTGGSGKTMTVNVGETAKIKVNKATKKNYKIASVKVSSNKIRAAKNKAGTVVTVRGLVATEGNKPAAIKVSFTSKKTKKTSKYTFASKVTVVGKAEEKPEVLGIKEVKQNKFTSFTATFSDKVTEIKTADLTIVRDSDNESIVIKSVAVDSADATKVNFETFKSLTDGATYTVTYTAADEAKTQSTAKVTVTDGTVAAVNITPTEITYNTRTTIKYQTIDKDGVIISEYPVRDANKESKVDIDFESAYGTLDNDTSKLILYNVGDTAKFTVTYHTYKYTTSGEEEGAVKGEFEVKAVESATTLTSYTYTTVDENKAEPYDWKSVTPKNYVAVNDSSSELGRKKAYFYITDNNGNYATKDLDYTVESSDNSIIIADGTVKDGATLEPVAVGNAHLILKNSDGKVVKTLPIEVKAKRTLATLSLDKKTVTVVTGANATADMDNDISQSFRTTLKDNYGDDYGFVNLEIKAVDEKKDHALFDSKTAEGNYHDWVVEGQQNDDTTGTFTYKVTATDSKNNGVVRTQLVDVKIVSRKGTISKALIFTDKNGKKVTSVDNKWDSANLTKMNVAVYDMVNGAVLQKTAIGNNNVSKAAIKVTKSNGTLIAASGSGITKAVTCAAVSGACLDGEATTVTAGTVQFAVNQPRKTGEGYKYLAADSYNFTYEFQELKDGKVIKYTPKATLKVTDSDIKYTATVLVTSTSVNDLTDFFDDKDNVSIYCGNVKMDDTAAGTGEWTTNSVSYSTNSDKSTAFVKSIDVEVQVEGGTDYIVVTIPINKSIKTSSKPWNE